MDVKSRRDFTGTVEDRG